MEPEKRNVEYDDGLIITDVDAQLADELEELAARKKKPTDPMDLVRFYRGEISTGERLYDHEGYTFDEIMKFNYEQLESYHRWVQWVFPTKERSFFQPDVPILNNEVIKLFQEDEVLQHRTKWAFLKVIDFYGFELKEENGEEQVVLQQEGYHHANPKWAIQFFNHNYLRITRVLTALRYFGHNEWSVKFKNALMEHANRDTESTMFWEQAATGYLV